MSISRREIEPHLGHRGGLGALRRLPAHRWLLGQGLVVGIFSKCGTSQRSSVE